MSPDVFHEGLTFARDDEGLFARDVDGQLIRVVAASQHDYDTAVTLTIDGDEITVMKAVPSTDAQGNILNDEHGRTVPRRTTIYDAVTTLFNRRRAGHGERHPVPTLCHREHMSPVGVCRVCVVALGRRTEAGQRTEERLVPACVHPVEAGMVVHTMASPQPATRERIEASVRVVVELMAADHLAADQPPDAGPTAPNELGALAARLRAEPARFRLEPRLPATLDTSSHLIGVDRARCVLCDRCVRACNEVRANFVIGRSGKGYGARIAFDLDVELGASTCVSCGECMVSCPTDALVFRQPVESSWRRERLRAAEHYEVSAAHLKRHPLFEDMPLKFLEWNIGAVVGWHVKRGQVLCRQGEAGGTAFILLRGRFGFWKRPGGPRGLLDWIRHPGRAAAGPPPGPPDGEMTPDDVIVGEMTCMNNQPRTATVAALEDGEVWMVRRNLLYVLQRDRHARERLDRIYRERALENHLRDVSFFADLDEPERQACRRFLKERVELVRVDPGQVIFSQGEKADAFYMIRHGHVKTSQVIDGEPRVLAYLRPNTYFGEIGLVSREVIDGTLPPERWDRRTATCSALDHVELVRIRRDDFRELLRAFPSLLKTFVQAAQQRLNDDQAWSPGVNGLLADFLDHGLYNGDRLLVLDMNACTRCDLCVRACADSHGGISRLVREGPRMDRFLVAGACRSCTDPYCLVGCPVDAIHRDGSLETVIEDHCIGCGQCARNCPYHNIHMVTVGDGAVAQRRAVSCDLCRDVVSHPGSEEVRCVYSCPHHAAFRISGDELWRRLTGEVG
ncbi:MAG TPA: cyclic nucleotide-binding domain-containing protein [Methylomirabilota bacterium]